MSGPEKNIESILKINHFVFNTLKFERSGFRQKSHEIKTEIGVIVKRTDEGHYTVTLQVSAEKQDEYSAFASISGYCEISENVPNKEIILKENAPAILFPYVRAQMSLLTAQPETEPLVLPVINFQKLYRESDKGEEQKDNS